jgi:hypothetical protein
MIATQVTSELRQADDDFEADHRMHKHLHILHAGAEKLFRT